MSGPHSAVLKVIETYRIPRRGGQCVVMAGLVEGDEPRLTAVAGFLESLATGHRWRGQWVYPFLHPWEAADRVRQEKIQHLLIEIAEGELGPDVGEQLVFHPAGQQES